VNQQRSVVLPCRCASLGVWVDGGLASFLPSLMMPFGSGLQLSVTRCHPSCSLHHHPPSRSRPRPDKFVILLAATVNAHHPATQHPLPSCLHNPLPPSPSSSPPSPPPSQSTTHGSKQELTPAVVVAALMLPWSRRDVDRTPRRIIMAKRQSERVRFSVCWGKACAT